MQINVKCYVSRDGEEAFAHPDYEEKAERYKMKTVYRAIIIDPSRIAFVIPLTMVLHYDDGTAGGKNWILQDKSFKHVAKCMEE